MGVGDYANLCTVTGQRDCKDRNCELHYMDAPLKVQSNPIPGPIGRTSRIWYSNGYAQAMRDIQEAYNRGGDPEIHEWVRNNSR